MCHLNCNSDQTYLYERELPVYPPQNMKIGCYCKKKSSSSGAIKLLERYHCNFSIFDINSFPFWHIILDSGPPMTDLNILRVTFLLDRPSTLPTKYLLYHLCNQYLSKTTGEENTIWLQENAEIQQTDFPHLRSVMRQVIVRAFLFRHIASLRLLSK